MTRVELFQANEEHARALAPAMRPADRLEIQASGGWEDPLPCLYDALDFSELAIAACFDGEVAALFGVGAPEDAPASILCGPSTGVAWLLTGSAVDRYKLSFLKVCRQLLPVALEKYPTLVNAIDARHRSALRWAQWLGFEVCLPIPFGREARLFHPVILRRSSFHV